MTKFKKIIIVIVSLSLLVLSMVLPSFAYTIDDDGTIDIDKVELIAERFTPPYVGEPCITFSFPTIDLNELIETNGNWFFFDISVEGLSSNEDIMIPSVLLAYGNIASQKSFEFHDTRLGGDVVLKYTINYNNTMYITIDCTSESRYYKEFVQKMRMTIQIHPHISTINEVLKAVPDADKAELLLRIEGLENQLTDNQYTIDELNTTVDNKNQEIFVLNEEIMNLYADQIKNENKIKEQEETILALREGMENNNAIFSLFNGIGNGIYSLVSPLLSLSIGGISIGAMIAFICALVLVFFLVKLIFSVSGKE